MLVFLDRQHCGKPNRWKDLGASRDLDENGIVSTRECEAILTAIYILECEIILREKGYDVCVLSDGHYSERHKRVNDYQGDENAVYISCHINAGAARGGYGSCFYDHRSTTGDSLASAICEELKVNCPELNNRTKIIECNPSDWTKNAYYTIKGVNCTAICYEPFFIDCEAHEPLLTAEGLRRVGKSLAIGIDMFFKTELS